MVLAGMAAANGLHRPVLAQPFTTTLSNIEFIGEAEIPTGLTNDNDFYPATPVTQFFLFAIEMEP